MNCGAPFDLEPILRAPSAPSKFANNADINPQDMVKFLDLTSLNSDDNSANITVLCDLGIQHKVAALCVYPRFLPEVTLKLNSVDVKSCTVTGSFPHGLGSSDVRLQETTWAANHCADEIDIVIPRFLALQGDYATLYKDIQMHRKAAGTAKLKVIICTSELKDPGIISKTSWVACLAGADFIKTSTGKEDSTATVEQGAAICHALKLYQQEHNAKVGFKASGGIKSYEQARSWYSLVAHQLGEEWLTPNKFRIGASSLLHDLVSRT